MPTPSLRILVVDDQHARRLSIEKTLNQQGYFRIAPVACFNELLAMVQSAVELFDLMVINSNMAAGNLFVGRGVTMTPYRGETMAIVNAPGAEGSKVAGYPRLKLDGNGNAVVPCLRPYELNEVAIDPIGSSLNVEFNETSQSVGMAGQDGLLYARIKPDTRQLRINWGS